MTSALCLRLQGRRHSAASYPSLLGIKKSRTENQKRNSRPLCLCPRPVCPCRSPPLRCASLLPSPASTSTLPLTRPSPPPASTCCLPAPVLLLALFLPLHPLLLATSLMLFSFYHTESLTSQRQNWPKSILCPATQPQPLASRPSLVSTGRAPAAPSQRRALRLCSPLFSVTRLDRAGAPGTLAMTRRPCLISSRV